MVLLVAVKLKHHRLKPGGVLSRFYGLACSCKVEAPPAKAWWCPNEFENFPVDLVTVYEVKEERLTRRSPAVPIE